MTDLDIARSFFDMLKSNGVTIKEWKEEPSNAVCFKIFDHCWPTCSATEFSFYEDGTYWRIDGAINGPEAPGFNKNKIHIRGWK